MELSDPDRVLALAHVPPPARPAMAALWALDERLATIAFGAREPALGLVRLVWWRDALETLAIGPPPADPVLAACAGAGLDGAALAAMTEGWEALLDDPDIGEAAAASHAGARGGRLFVLAGTLLDAAPADAPRLAAAGAGWALAGVARHLDRTLGRPARAAGVRATARDRLDEAMATRWPRRLRPLGELAALARAGIGDPPPGPRRRALIVLAHQITGR